jgi:hypothetical protein
MTELLELLKDFATRLPGTLLLILATDVVAGLFLTVLVDPPQIIGLVIILLLSIVIGGLSYNTDQRRLKAEGEAKGLRTAIEWLGVWTRPMLRQPLKPAAYSEVDRVFEAAIGEACQALSEVGDIEVDPSNVRANVFLPSREGTREGDVCTLAIPRHETYAVNHLQRHMTDANERGISFRPNQGATGRVFVEGAAVGVLTNPDWLKPENMSKRENLERWINVRLHPDQNLDEDQFKSVGSGTFGQQFEMSHLQDRQASDRLTWIISMPIFLKVDDALEIVGVFNVDCLEHQVKPEQLRAIFYRLAPYAGALAGALHGSPIDRIAIHTARG